MFGQTSPTPSLQKLTSPSASLTACGAHAQSKHDDPLRRFDEHVERTAVRLEAWRAYLDEQDRFDAPRGGAAGAPSERLATTHAPVFFAFLDDRLAELAAVIEPLDREHQRHAGERLRARLMPWLSQSQFIARTIERPRGYAGDAEMMRMIYERGFVGSTTFAKLMHRHPIESAAAQAVRNRRGLISRLLAHVEARRGKRSKALNVLSVACGPAWELRDLYRTATDAARFRCTLIDQDPEALETARAGLEDQARAVGQPLEATFVRQSVKGLLRSPQERAGLGQFEFIYSMGLYDYLPEAGARELTRRLYDLLAPGGTLVLGNYHVASPTRVYMGYWMNWPLEYRTAEQFLELAPAAATARTSVAFDETGAQMFLRVDRRR
jgi:SAM-dependent methyltransferase